MGDINNKYSQTLTQRPSMYRHPRKPAKNVLCESLKGIPHLKLRLVASIRQHLWQFKYTVKDYTQALYSVTLFYFYRLYRNSVEYLVVGIHQ